MKRNTLFAVMLMLLASAWAINAQDLTGDDILARAAEAGALTAEGSRINRIQFDIVSADGSTLPQREFAFFGKSQEGEPDRLLIYFIAPELENGTIFLSLDPVDVAEDSRIWLFLPAFGQIKELVSDSDRDAGFAGSNLQNDQIGGSFDFDEDYAGELLGQEMVSVNWLAEDVERNAFKVELTRKPESDVDFIGGTVWVDVEHFTVLKSEFINEGGVLEQISSLNNFIEFEDKFEPNTILVENVLDNSTTTITIVERISVEELPDEMFTPEALADFDPADYGIEG